MPNNTTDETQEGTIYVNHSKEEQDNHQAFNSELWRTRGTFENPEMPMWKQENFTYTEKDMNLYVGDSTYDLDVVVCERSAGRNTEQAWTVTVTDEVGNSAQVYLRDNQMFVSEWTSANGAELTPDQITDLVRASEQTANVYTTMTGNDISRMSFDYYCETTADEVLEENITNQLYYELGMHPYDYPNIPVAGRPGDFNLAGSEIPDQSKFSYDSRNDVTLPNPWLQTQQGSTDTGISPKGMLPGSGSQSGAAVVFCVGVKSLEQQSRKMSIVGENVANVKHTVSDICSGMSGIGLSGIIPSMEGLERKLGQCEKMVESCSTTLGRIAMTYQKAEANITA